MAEVQKSPHEGRVSHLWATAANTIIKVARNYISSPVYYRVSAETPLQHPNASPSFRVAYRKPDIVGSATHIPPEPEQLRAVVPLDPKTPSTPGQPRTNLDRPLLPTANNDCLPQWSEVLVMVEMKPKPKSAKRKNDNDESHPEKRLRKVKEDKSTERSSDDDQYLPDEVATHQSTKLTPFEQLTGYVLEMVSSLGDRRFGYGILVHGQDMELCYWDHVGGISSELVPIRDKRFIQVIIALAIHGPAHLGFDPILSSSYIGRRVGEATEYLAAMVAKELLPDTASTLEDTTPAPVSQRNVQPPDPLRSPETTLTPLFAVPECDIQTPFPPGNFPRVNFTLGSWNFSLGALIVARRGLVGRGTVIRKARYYRADGQPYHEGIFKSSWANPSRTSESEYMRCAADTGLSQITNHIPKVLLAVELLSTDTFRHRDFLGTADTQRVQRIILMDRICQPIWTLVDGALVKKVFRELVTCHRWLYAEAGILHRDISIGNLRWYRRGEETLGCLIDLDLAIMDDKTGNRIQTAAAGERTGTTPFLAMPLLSPIPPPHCYHHDLESFLYVMVWLYAKYRHGKPRLTANAWLYDWNHGELRSMKREKYFFLGFPAQIVDELPRTSTYLPMYPWILSLAEMFAKLEDGDTSNGRHVYEKFMAIIDKDPDTRPPSRQFQLPEQPAAQDPKNESSAKDSDDV